MLEAGTKYGGVFLVEHLTGGGVHDEQSPFAFADGSACESASARAAKRSVGDGLLPCSSCCERMHPATVEIERGEKTARLSATTPEPTTSFIHRSAIGKIHGLKVYSKAYRGCWAPRFGD